MIEFNSEFEELVEDLNLSQADTDFNLIFSDFDFEEDTNKINAEIDKLYIKYEVSKCELEKLDEVLENLNGESIKELLKDVYGEEIKGKPVTFLAKQFEFQKIDNTDQNRISCASYKTAKDELSDYDSIDESGSSSDYDSCDESNISSPVAINSEQDLFKWKNVLCVPEEKIQENVITQNYTENEVSFRISEEEKIEEIIVRETNIKSNKTDFRLRSILSSWQNQHDKMKHTDETERQKKRDGEKELVTIPNTTQNEVIFRISEKIDENIITGTESVKEKSKNTEKIRQTKNEKIEIVTDENKNQTFQTSTDLPDSFAPKRKLSDRAKEISESIVGKTLKPLTSSDPSYKLPLSVQSMTKSKPNRKSFECLPSKNEFELKLQEIRKKMELRNSQIGSYQSVYPKH